MKEFVDKLIERLEEKERMLLGNSGDIGCTIGITNAMACAIEIVKDLAEEHNNGWISVEDALPEEAFGCLVTIMDCNPMTLTDFETVLPYHVGYDGETWNDIEGNVIPFEVIAWQPIPTAPYKKGE